MMNDAAAAADGNSFNFLHGFFFLVHACAYLRQCVRKDVYCSDGGDGSGAQPDHNRPSRILSLSCPVLSAANRLADTSFARKSRLEKGGKEKNRS